jgi:hypothetical protein
MPRFSELPMDLLPHVLNYLSKKEYNALVRVCKSLHKEVRPRLYQEVTFKAGKSRHTARRLACFLRTLIEHPQLARYVSVFRLLGPHPCWAKYNPWSEEEESMNLWGLEGCTTLSKAQRIFASNQLYQLVDEDMHTSLSQFRGRSKDALAVLVLTRFSEMTTLELGDGFLMYSLFLPHILKRGTNLFPKLSHVIFGDTWPDPENTISYIDLDLIRAIFYLPTVTDFEWRMSQPWQFQWGRPQPPRNDSLTSLNLFRANIYRSTLGELLTAAPALKRFGYDQEILFNRSIPESDLAPFTNLQGLNAALRGATDTLEEIKLSIHRAPGSLSSKQILDYGIKFPPINGTLGVFKHMKKLIMIELPMFMLLGWDPNFTPRFEEVLPHGIEQLTLRDDFVYFCPWGLECSAFKKTGLIGDYIAARKTHAPQLHTLKIRLRKSRNSMFLDDAIADMNAPLFGDDVSHHVAHESSAEIHTWHFRTEEVGLPVISSIEPIISH